MPLLTPKKKKKNSHIFGVLSLKSLLSLIILVVLSRDSAFCHQTIIFFISEFDFLSKSFEFLAQNFDFLLI